MNIPPLAPLPPSPALELDRINRSSVSRITGLSQSYISYVLDGKRSPSLQSAEKICRALESETGVPVSLDQLWYRLIKPRMR